MSREDVAEAHRISRALSQKFVADTKRISKALSQGDFAEAQRFSRALSQTDIAEGKPISKALAQEDVPADRRIPKALDSSGRCENCPLKNSSESGTVGLAQRLNVPESKADKHQSPTSNDTDEESEEIPPRRPCPLQAILDGMPKEWIEDGEESYTIVIQDKPPPRKVHPLVAILSGMPQVLDRRESQMTRALFLKDFDAKLQNINRDDESKEPELGRLRRRHYTQILDAMSTAVESTDEKTHDQSLNHMVEQTGDEGLISSWEAKKKKRAHDLAFRTRQSVQMLNTMINVREFTDDAREYSVWLDEVAPEDKESESDEPEITEPEDGDPQEPRFREDSAANFLNSAAVQILHEFSQSKKSKAGGKLDKSKGPTEPSFREDSAANFLGAMSHQIKVQFTDDRSTDDETGSESEGSRKPRFREKSAITFLAALEEQLLLDFKNKSSDKPAIGIPRFREKSAIDFLDALRDEIMQRDSHPPTEGPSSSDQDVQSDTKHKGVRKPPSEGPSSSDQVVQRERKPKSVGKLPSEGPSSSEQDFRLQTKHKNARKPFSDPSSSDQDSQSATENESVRKPSSVGPSSSDQNAHLESKHKSARKPLYERPRGHDVQSKTKQKNLKKAPSEGPSSNDQHVQPKAAKHKNVKKRP